MKRIYDYLGRKLYSASWLKSIVDHRGAKTSAIESLKKALEDTGYIITHFPNTAETLKETIYLELENSITPTEYEHILFKIDSVMHDAKKAYQNIRETIICVDQLSLEDEQLEEEKVTKCIKMAYLLMDDIIELLKSLDYLAELGGRYPMNRAVFKELDTEIIPVAANCFMELSTAAANIQRIGAKYGIRVEHIIRKDKR